MQMSKLFVLNFPNAESLAQACFFNVWPPSGANKFAEILSLAAHFLSLAVNSLSLEANSLRSIENSLR